MHSRCQFSIVMFLAGTLAFVGPAGRMSAAGVPRNLASAAGTNLIVAELHATKALLEKADHDYQGHRAKAVHDITQAIHELHHHHGQNHKAMPKGQHAGKSVGQQGQKPAANGGGKLKEPQQVSDAQLRQAIQQLTVIAGQLGSTHAKVHAHVTDAIKQLNVALTIK